MARRCPVPECTEALTEDQHFCAVHWNRIPGVIARRIVQTHRELRHGASGALASYQEAIGEACAVIGAKLQHDRRP